jgi:hypothetical protein
VLRWACEKHVDEIRQRAATRAVIVKKVRRREA